MTPNSTPRVGLSLAVVGMVLVAAPVEAQTGATKAAVSTAAASVAMTGLWKYNENESVDASTGRRETAHAANDRVGVGSVSGGAAPSGAIGPEAMYAEFIDEAMYMRIAEQRATLRDLLEIPQWLRIDVTAAAVSISDDLERQLVFPLDGKRRKYQLGAAIFDGKASWNRGQLRIEIEGRTGPSMMETWFLNETGSKLFQVIRVEAPPGDRDRRPAGINRVYDRAK
jgi:hypothetical protein